MNNYSIINVQTQSTLTSIHNIQEENTREKLYADIDKEKSLQNKYDDFVPFKEMYNKAMQNEYYTKKDKYGRTHKEPKIKAIDLVLTFSPDMKGKIDIDKWYDAQKKFIEEQFPNCPYSLVLHKDQTTEHCHAQVLPITPEGKISKSYYIKNKQALRDLHTAYGKAMEEFGLRRGEYRTTEEQNHMNENQKTKYEEIKNRYESKEQEQEFQQQYIDFQKEEMEKEISDMEQKKSTLQGDIKALQGTKEEIDRNINQSKKELSQANNELISTKKQLYGVVENIAYIIEQTTIYKYLKKKFDKVKEEYELLKDMKKMLKTYKDRPFFTLDNGEEVDINEVMKNYLYYKEQALELHQYYKEYDKEPEQDINIPTQKDIDILDEEYIPYSIDDINNMIFGNEEPDEDIEIK